MSRGDLIGLFLPVRRGFDHGPRQASTSRFMFCGRPPTNLEVLWCTPANHFIGGDRISVTTGNARANATPSATEMGDRTRKSITLDLDLDIHRSPDSVRAWWTDLPDEYVAKDPREQPHRIRPGEARGSGRGRGHLARAARERNAPKRDAAVARGRELDVRFAGDGDFGSRRVRGGVSRRGRSLAHPKRPYAGPTAWKVGRPVDGTAPGPPHGRKLAHGGIDLRTGCTLRARNLPPRRTLSGKAMSQGIYGQSAMGNRDGSRGGARLEYPRPLEKEEVNR